MNNLEIVILIVTIVILILVILVSLELNKMDQKEGYDCNNSSTNNCLSCQGEGACKGAGCLLCNDNSCRLNCLLHRGVNNN